MGQNIQSRMASKMRRLFSRRTLLVWIAFALTVIACARVLQSVTCYYLQKINRQTQTKTEYENKTKWLFLLKKKSFVDSSLLSRTNDIGTSYINYRCIFVPYYETIISYDKLGKKRYIRESCRRSGESMTGPETTNLTVISFILRSVGW